MATIDVKSLTQESRDPSQKFRGEVCDPDGTNDPGH